MSKELESYKYNGKTVYVRAVLDTNPDMVLVSYTKTGPQFKVDTKDLVGYIIK
jgi:endo-alpha-1,4-polygalactosaminidase (GH114 family)